MSQKKYKLQKIFDIRIRTLFKNHHIVVDFINGILFYGNAIIHFDDISLDDSNLDSHLPIQNITRERERDNIYLVKIDDHECLIGIEHQSQIDRSMFQRTREYDETHDITVSHEIAISLAALTKNTQIYEKVKEKKIDMCQAIRDYGKENLRIGKKEGIIQTLIKQLQSKLGFLSKDTLAKIESCNQEQLDSLTIHIFDIHSEKDILHYLSFD